MEVVIEKMAAGGKGIAHHKGKVVFIPGVLPGETVICEPQSMKRDFIEANLVEVTEKSPQRVQPLCPRAHLCGGCDFCFAQYPYQLELKKAVLADILRRANLHPGDEFPITVYPSPLPIEYRCRFRFRIMPPGIPALTARSSNNPVPVDDCLCAVSELRQALKDGSLRKRITASLAAESAKKRRPIADDCSVHVFASNTGRIATSLDDDTVIPVDVCGKTLCFDVRGFFQSNRSALEQLIPHVTGNLSGSRALDLYCGAGTFSVFLQDTFSSVVLMEHNEGSLEQARYNMEHNISTHGAETQYCTVSDKNWSENSAAQYAYDAIVADPPRQGLTPSMITWLAAHPAAVFRYVSCDPVTMARDVRQLCERGYVIDEIQLHDFYPQTSHMETLTLLRYTGR